MYTFLLYILQRFSRFASLFASTPSSRRGVCVVLYSSGSSVRRDIFFFLKSHFLHFLHGAPKFHFDVAETVKDKWYLRLWKCCCICALVCAREHAALCLAGYGHICLSC